MDRSRRSPRPIEIDTSTYQAAVDQMWRELGPVDDRAAAAWFVLHAPVYRNAGLSYQGFMLAFEASMRKREKR